MEQHVYTSSKGDFLNFFEWTMLNGTVEEKALFDIDENTDAKKALYNKWVKAEQIISHVCILEDGTEQNFPSPADA